MDLEQVKVRKSNNNFENEYNSTQDRNNVMNGTNEFIDINNDKRTKRSVTSS